MIWHGYRRCSLMYRLTTFSSTLPTVSAKYPSAQKLSPHRNSSSSGYSFQITRLVPPFNVCATPATLSPGFVWMIRCTWSSRTLSSLIHHLFIRHAWYNNPLRRMAILPRSTRRRYFGIHTRWYCKRCFVWDRVSYLAMARSCRKLLRSASFHLAMFRKAAIHPRLESLGFSGQAYKILQPSQEFGLLF
jgi:hypothetical protein